MIEQTLNSGQRFLQQSPRSAVLNNSNSTSTSIVNNVNSPSSDECISNKPGWADSKIENLDEVKKILSKDNEKLKSTDLSDEELTPFVSEKIKDVVETTSSDSVLLNDAVEVANDILEESLGSRPLDIAKLNVQTQDLVTLYLKAQEQFNNTSSVSSAVAATVGDLPLLKLSSLPDLAISYWKPLSAVLTLLIPLYAQMKGIPLWNLAGSIPFDLLSKNLMSLSNIIPTSPAILTPPSVSTPVVFNTPNVVLDTDVQRAAIDTFRHISYFYCAERILRVIKAILRK